MTRPQPPCERAETHMPPRTSKSDSGIPTDHLSISSGIASDDRTSLSGFVAQKQESLPSSRHGQASTATGAVRTCSLVSVLNEPTVDRKPLDPTNAMNMPAVLTPNTISSPDLSTASKDSVTPHRSKPGRKPTTDTPPTKRAAQNRAAQNRAAQRAFRARRVARVEDLENQLRQQKATHDEKEIKLEETVRNLEVELQSCRSLCLMLKELFEKECKERVWEETEAELSKRQRNSSCSCHGSIASLPSTLPPTDHHRIGSSHIPQFVSLPPLLPSLKSSEMRPFGTDGQNPAPKRPASPSAMMSADKRQRPDAIITELSVNGAPPNSVALKGACPVAYARTVVSGHHSST